MIPIRDNVPSRHTPVVMWALILINSAVFLVELGLPPERLKSLVYTFGVVPLRYAEAWREGGLSPLGWILPFFTHMFLHGGLLHVAANMWMLGIFGDNVEDRMGSVRFLLFYLICGLAATLTHLFMNLQSDLPTIGASGAIAGVLAAYLLLYPMARLIVVVPVFFWPLFFQVPALVFMGAWFLLQLLSGVQVAGSQEQAGVAWWAHVGGFAAGAVLGRLMVVRKGPQRRTFGDEQGLEGAWSRQGS